jgi:hypothetical protein
MRYVVVLLALFTAGCATARSAPAPAPAPPATVVIPGMPGDTGRAAAPERSAGPGAPGEASPRPYSRVITPAAQTREGVFRTHRVGSRLFFEIPRAELNKEMLLVTQIARTTLGAGYGGQAVSNRVLRWERRDNRILLRSVSYEITADTTLPIYEAVSAANYDPVLAIFNIEAFGPDSAAVIEVTRLFTTGTPEFGAGNRIRGSLDSQRSFIERVTAFPENVNVEATHTYTVTPPSPPNVPEQFRPTPTTASVLMHWSMVRLPEQPMMPRLHDSRVGYFAVSRQDFGTEEHRAARRRFITRWRLECPPGESIPCEPVKPIVYYVDPATPAQWVPWIKRGVEDWQRAFEEAGFRNAIVARDAPSRAEDPDWAAEDARYSVIRWLPSTIENATGPHVHDPRTGEILESDIQMYHNVLNLLRAWYFVQVAPLDPRARRLPLPDTLMGRLLQYVVAHEVGHTLGLPHNQKASATYAADSIRNSDFVRRMGHTPTLMDYSRFNYVAQPEDNIPPELLVPDIGPYDRFAIMWGYRPIPEAPTPEAERATLDSWARQQDTIPYLRFSTTGSMGADAGDHTEAVGDADAVRSTGLGLRNLQRVVPMLIPATETPGEDFSDLRELYDRLIGQWATELNHVVTVVGGVESQEKYAGQDGVRFTPMPRQRQQEAVRFLNENAFRTPEHFLDPEILRRIEVQGAIDRVGRAQARVLNALLNDVRMQRMIEFEALARRPGEVYALGDMFADLRQGIWGELSNGSVRIDAFRRNLQRTYLDVVNGKVNPPARPPTTTSPAPGVIITTGGSPTASDARALLRGELQALDTQLRTALGRTSDRTTRLHLEDARAQIDRILNPR